MPPMCAPDYWSDRSPCSRRPYTRGNMYCSRRRPLRCDSLWEIRQDCYFRPCRRSKNPLCCSSGSVRTPGEYEGTERLMGVADILIVTEGTFDGTYLALQVPAGPGYGYTKTLSAFGFCPLINFSKFLKTS